MTATASHIEDITWDMIEAAGIDIQHVAIQPDSHDGAPMWVYQHDDTRIVFAPARDLEDGTTYGFDIAVYDLDADGFANQAAQNWAETPAETLAYVARFAR